MDYKKLSYDLVVCGGGIPGVCAAITAARNGIKVALTEQRPLLGGNSSSLALVPPHGAASLWHNRHAREGGILEELLQEYAFRSPFADNRCIWDFILSEWCHREPNLDLYLNARLSSADSKNNRVVSTTIVQTSTETEYVFTAPLFVDATGDAFLADAVGAELRRGREAQAEFGESLAPDIGDSKTLPSALYMIAHRRSRPAPFTPPEWVPKHEGCGDFPHRPHSVGKFAKGKALSEDASAIQLFWWCSLGGERDTIKDNEEIYRDLVAEAMGIWDHLKNHCTPETREALKYYEAVWWSPFPLRRESRRVMGDHILIESDIFAPKVFDDRVSYGGWPVDVHPPEGIYSKEPPCDQTFVNELYSVPFGIMYSRNIPNLMLAGRCISTSHVAMGSIRVMNSLGAAAQAVGAAAAICVERHIDPRQVRSDHIAELQQRLLKADSHILSLRNADPHDLALEATVSTSSSLQFQVGSTDGFVELDYDLAQQIPVSEDRINTVSILLKSTADTDTHVDIALLTSTKLGRFTNQNPIHESQAILKPGEERWVTVDVNADVTPQNLLWIRVGRNPDVQWGFSHHEDVGARFAARFNGDLTARPSHGKAQVAPVTDDWFPLNHNGRLPHELHDWVSDKIGMKFDRRVRATFCHRIDPPSRPYQGANATNGVSRPEDWPNIWISDPTQSLPQSLDLAWTEPKSIREIYLTFDTDLDAPDRCYGWPREEHRFVFPVALCVKDYRVLGQIDGAWTELLHITDNFNRRRIHQLDAPMDVTALRVEVLSTHGDASARIYEIRAY
ncbi:MAG: hypothetical protein SynsKO_14650 [Synoicihabitans sp.]